MRIAASSGLGVLPENNPMRFPLSALFVVAAFSFLAAPGVRLLLLASRTRQAPELLCGLYFVGLAIGIPLRIHGAQQFLADPGGGPTLNGQVAE